MENKNLLPLLGIFNQKRVDFYFRGNAACNSKKTLEGVCVLFFGIWLCQIPKTKHIRPRKVFLPPKAALPHNLGYFTENSEKD